mgnify:CR=1 FL=1
MLEESKDENYIWKGLYLSKRDFARIDADIHPSLAQKFNFPPLEPAPVLTGGFQERSLVVTNFLDLGVIFKRLNDETKYFIPMTAMKRMIQKQLEITQKLQSTGPNTKLLK